MSDSPAVGRWPSIATLLSWMLCAADTAPGAVRRTAISQITVAQQKRATVYYESQR